MAEPKIVQATQGFQVYVDGAPFLVKRGDLFAADDPIVKGRGASFGEVKVRTSHRTPVPARPAAAGPTSETTDAPPDAKRTVTRPPTTRTGAGSGTSKGGGKADA